MSARRWHFGQKYFLEKWCHHPRFQRSAVWILSTKGLGALFLFFVLQIARAFAVANAIVIVFVLAFYSSKRLEDFYVS